MTRIPAAQTVPRHPLRRALERWVVRHDQSERGEVVLRQRRIFILPTRAGLAYALMLLGLFIGSVNYQLNMGFALTFLVAGCALVGMVLTFRNLAWLVLSPGRTEPVFAGDQAHFDLRIANRNRHARYAIMIGFVDGDQSGVETVIDLRPFEECTVRLSTTAYGRGWQQAPRVRLHTRFPLGLLRAWSYWQPGIATLVYPQPEADAPPLPTTMRTASEDSGRAGREDFAGVRGWQAGDSPSRLAWRQIARMDDGASALISKHFEGGTHAELAIDESLVADLPLEQRLSRMTRWVLEAEQRGLSWCFALGNTVLPAARGQTHLEECLRSLALYRNGVE